jgi:hypothetical protein
MEFRKALMAATIAGASFGFAGSAVASHVPGIGFNAQNFTFDATAYGGSEFTARFIDFSYEAEVDQQVAIFQETGVGFFSSFRTDLSSPPIADTGLTTDYRMYAIFDGTGTVTPSGSGGVNGTFTTFNARIFIDPNEDTEATTFQTGAAGGNESKGVTGNADDVEILEGTLLVGGFHVFPGLANGDFDVQFIVESFDETVWGGPAFAGPIVIGDINGVNTSIQGVGAPGTTFIDARINGSGNVSFQSVPEPGSLSLLGLGLFGLGALLRTRRQRGLRAAA